ncbi:MAG: IMP cyclohydrolase [Kiritimatiellae bacterium]|nr:IMP cyclohydrolase [Kiritimatiellia bacterium]
MLNDPESNLEALQSNAYPGRGIIMGLSPDGSNFVQVYWIMGRSSNSRNRIFVHDGSTVRTAPFDESRVEDPSLIIYNCVRVHGDAHIVSNGDQTDTIFDALKSGGSFESALKTRTFEPDAPNFTPRISGILTPGQEHAYSLSVLKSIDNNPHQATRQFYHYTAPVAGIGHYVSTYIGDGSPLPSFAGEPQPMPLHDDPDDALERFWDSLNEDNRVSLLVKYLSIESGESQIRIMNANTL